MGERIHTTATQSNSGTKKKKTWTLVISGIAVLLLAAGVMLQVTRPSSGFSDDGTGGAVASPGKANTGEPTRKKTIAKVGKKYITYEQLAERTHLSRGTVTNYLTKPAHRRGTRELQLLVDALDAPAADRVRVLKLHRQTLPAGIDSADVEWRARARASRPRAASTPPCGPDPK
jgi:transcriptional regulator with XRE-family HTH domain